MSVTEKQLNANRQNAQKSTGSKTPEGIYLENMSGRCGHLPGTTCPQISAASNIEISKNDDSNPIFRNCKECNHLCEFLWYGYTCISINPLHDSGQSRDSIRQPLGCPGTRNPKKMTEQTHFENKKPGRCGHLPGTMDNLSISSYNLMPPTGVEAEKTFENQVMVSRSPALKS